LWENLLKGKRNFAKKILWGENWGKKIWRKRDWDEKFK